MATTYEDFVEGIAALSISGVSVQYVHPPLSLNVVPASWVQLPTGDEGAMTFGYEGGWPTLNVQLVVAIISVAQDRQPQNFEAALQMMDAVSTALRGADVTTYCKSALHWSMRMANVAVGEHVYWAVVTDITGQG